MTASLQGADPAGATPLGEDELDGLIPPDVTTRDDLNRAELNNIVVARTWAAARPWTPDTLLRENILRDLHRRMFGEVWQWAGRPRRRELNIGVAPAAIAVELRNLLDDTRAWIEYGTY